MNRATVLMYTQIASKGVRQLVHCLIDGAIHALFSALALSVPGLFYYLSVKSLRLVHRNRGIVPCPLPLRTFCPLRVSCATTEMSINVATLSCSRNTWHIQLHSCTLKHSPGGIHERELIASEPGWDSCYSSNHVVLLHGFGNPWKG